MKTKPNLVSFPFPLRDKQRLRVAAAKRGLTMSAAIREAVLEWLAKAKRNGGK